MRRAKLVVSAAYGGLLPSRGRRFTPSVVTGNKRLTHLFPGKCAVIQEQSNRSFGNQLPRRSLLRGHYYPVTARTAACYDVQLL
jgi:hypothetical protein